MKQDRRVALIFSVVGFVVAISGILTTPGEFVGDVTWGILMYFTIASPIKPCARLRRIFGSELGAEMQA